MIRNLKLEVFVNDLNLHSKVRSSVRLYRAVMRKAFSFCAIAETAGSDITIKNGDISVLPNGDKSKEILSKIYDKNLKINYDEMRYFFKEFYPSLSPNCTSKIGYTINKMMTTKDLEIKKCNRKFLILNGKRAFAQFNKSGIPLKKGMLRIEGHNIICKWDSEIGEVKFNTQKLDASSYYAFSSIRENREGWKMKDSYLSFDENKNRIIIIMSFERPDTLSKIDPNKIMYIEFTEDKEKYITCYTDKKWSARPFSASGIIAYLTQMETIFSKYMSQLRSYHRGEYKQRKNVKSKLARYTERRANAEKNNNHLWSRRIIDFARQQCAGKLIVINMPAKTLFDLPYGWFDLKTKLQYKMKEIGGEVKFVDIDKEKQA